MSRHAIGSAGALALAALVALATNAGPAIAAENPAERPRVEWQGELDFNSHYVWRGISLSRGAVVNPSLTLSRGGWSLNAWANLDRDPQLQGTLNEVDLTLGWSANLLGFEFAPSLLYYAYPSSGTTNTAEAQIEIGRALHGPLSAFTRQSVEVIEVRGAAWSAAGLACELPEWRHVAVSANVQYGRGWRKFASAYADPGLEGLNLASVGVSAVVSPPGTAFTLRPHLEWYGVGNACVKDVLTGSTPWVVGLALGGSF